MKAFIAIAAAASAALLGACDGSQDENSGVTAEEAAMLNETENMLEAPVVEGEVPMDDLGGDTGELPVTDEAATNAGY